MLNDLKGRFKPGDIVYLRCEVVGYDSSFWPLGTVALRSIAKDRTCTEDPSVWVYAKDAHLVDPRAVLAEMKEKVQ